MLCHLLFMSVDPSLSSKRFMICDSWPESAVRALLAHCRTGVTLVAAQSNTHGPHAGANLQKPNTLQEKWTEKLTKIWRADARLEVKQWHDNWYQRHRNTAELSNSFRRLPPKHTGLSELVSKQPQRAEKTWISHSHPPSLSLTLSLLISISLSLSISFSFSLPLS